MTSGALGRWQTSGHARSDAAVDARAVAAPNGLLVVGDSVATRLLPALPAALPGRPIAHDTWNGRPSAPTVDALVAAEREGRLPGTVVMVCGSNDIFDPWRFEAQVTRCRQVVGTRRLLWVTPYVSRPVAPSADMRNTAVVATILERAEAGGLLEQVRWFEFLARSQGRLDALVQDGVHPTPAGAAALAGLIAAVLG